MDTTDFRIQMNADDTKEGKHFMGKRLLLIFLYWLRNIKTKTIGMGNSVSHQINLRFNIFQSRHVFLWNPEKPNEKGMPYF